MLKHPFCALQGSLHGRMGAMIAGKQHAVDFNIVHHALVMMGVCLWQRMTCLLYTSPSPRDPT